MSTQLLQSSPQGGSAHSSTRRSSEGHGKISVRGITLKQYFRLCGEQLNEIKEESVQSSKSSLLETPSFPHEGRHPKEKVIKFRTEISDSDGDGLVLIPRHCDLPTTNRTPPPKNQRKQHSHLPFHAQPRRKIFTKVPSQSGKQLVDAINRSTLGCFYQMQQKQRKMLRKVQADRQRAQELNLKQALSITKYGSRFNAD